MVDASLHMTHNFEIAPDNTIFVAGKEGIATLKRNGEGWDRGWVVQGTPADMTVPRSPSLWENPEFKGAGEVRLFNAGGPVPWIATVEPMHGNAAAVYVPNDATYGQEPNAG